MESGKNFQFPPMIESNAKISFPSTSYNEEKRQAGISKKAAIRFLLDMPGSVIVRGGLMLLNIPRGRFHLTDIHWE